MIKNKKYFGFLVIFLSVLLVSSLVSAGIGLKVEKTTNLVEEGKKGSFGVGVYNPFPGSTGAVVRVQGELADVLTQEASTPTLIPEFTSSENAIPIDFTFEVAKVYEREYKFGKIVDRLICPDQLYRYEGDVVVESAPVSSVTEGFAGSSTQMSVSQPINIAIACNPYGWDYSPIYIAVALLSAGVVGFILFRRYRKPESVRIKEKMAKLREEMKRAKK